MLGEAEALPHGAVAIRSARYSIQASAPSSVSQEPVVPLDTWLNIGAQP
jgi:hypothetical protein